MGVSCSPRLAVLCFFFLSSFLFSHSMVKIMKLIGPIVALELCRYGCTAYMDPRVYSRWVEWGGVGKTKLRREAG